MKILFVIRSTQHYQYFSSIIESLSKRGHKTEILFDKACSAQPIEDIKKNKRPFIHYDWVPYDGAKWRKIICYGRDLLTLRRYLLVQGQSDHYRMRNFKATPFFIRPFIKLSITQYFIKSNLFPQIMKLAEKLMPLDKKIINEIKKQKPDVVICAPASFSFFSAEVEYLKTAKSLSIPTVTPVFSWDNLTTKGYMSIKPDTLFVWNATQVEEAKLHHGFEEKNLCITGSSFFDRWFSELKPSMGRKEFCSMIGLNPEHPILVYLISSQGIAWDELWLVKKLRGTLDGSQDQQLRKVQLLVRPHPYNYKSVFPKSQNLVFYPQKKILPETQEAIQAFYDTIYYSIGTIGINSSAMIQSIILDKPVIGIFTKEYKDTQTDTQHFKQLIENDVISLAKSMKDCLKLIKRNLNGEDPTKKQRNEFIKKFIRPGGLKIPAGDIVVQEVEKKYEG